MSSAPAVLLCDAIEKLEQLASALAEVTDITGDAGNPANAGAAEVARVGQVQPLPPDRRLGKELLLSIRVLLPKLHTVRHLHATTWAPRPAVWPAVQTPTEGDAVLPLPGLPRRGCLSCEE